MWQDAPGNDAQAVQHERRDQQPAEPQTPADPARRNEPRDLRHGGHPERQRDIRRLATELNDSDADERERSLEPREREGEDGKHEPEPRLNRERSTDRTKPAAVLPLGAVRGHSDPRFPPPVRYPADQHQQPGRPDQEDGRRSTVSGPAIEET